MRRNKLKKHIKNNYTKDEERKLLLDYMEKNLEMLNKYPSLYPVINKKTGRPFSKYIPTVQEYLEFEQSCLGFMNTAAILENRSAKKYNISEKDLIDFYGFDYPGKAKKKSKNRDNFSKAEVLKQLELFKKMFDAEEDAYINIRCRSTGEYYAYNIKSLFDEDKLYNVLNSSRFSTKNDLMYSLNLFNNMKRLSTENIFTLFSIAIDVDFTEVRKYSDKKPKDIIKILEKTEFGKTIPTPNIVEYSNNLRLIYIFDKVYNTKSSSYLASRIARLIGERLADYKGKGQPVTTYGRIVGSINSKNNKSVKVMYLDVNKYTLAKLKEFTKPLQEWRAEHKAGSRKVINLGENFKKLARYTKNNLARIDDFFKIQEFYNFDPDGKRFMCFQVRNHAIIAGYSKEEAEQLMKDFNNRFRYPLRWNVIERDTRNVERKQYYYKSQTILNELAIDRDEEVLMGLKGIVSETEHKRRDNEANKARQKAKYRNEEGLKKTEIKRRNQFILIARMELQGMSYRSMVEILKVSNHTAITKKINKTYEKINYYEILEEVRQGLYDDIEVAIG